jgi:hypothetical protein
MASMQSTLKSPVNKRRKIHKHPDLRPNYYLIFLLQPSAPPSSLNGRTNKLMLKNLQITRMKSWTCLAYCHNFSLNPFDKQVRKLYQAFEITHKLELLKFFSRLDMNQVWSASRRLCLLFCLSSCLARV